MALVMLGSNSYRGELGPVSERGIEYTHLARLSVSSSEQPVRAFVKAYAPVHLQSGHASKGLVNELAGYFCAELGGLTVPKRAGLIVVDPSQLSDPPEWVTIQSTLVAWWSEDFGNQSIKATWNLTALPDGSLAQQEALLAARSFLVKHASTPSVIAFDDLIANIDRNLGNLLGSSGTLGLIDHGHCITGPAWLPSDLDPSVAYRNVIRLLLGPAAETLPFKSAVMDAYESIVGAITPHMSELRQLMGGLLDDDEADSAHSFIQMRGAPGSIAHRVGVVV